MANLYFWYRGSFSFLSDKKIKDGLINAIKKYINAFFGNNPKDSPDFSRIINEKHFKRLLGLMKEGHIVAGGQTEKETLYISPTIIDNVSFLMT